MRNNKIVRKLFEATRLHSLKQATKDNTVLMQNLRDIVPDISDQYTNLLVNTEYLEINLRAMHCFQISLAYRYLCERLKCSQNGSGEARGAISLLDIGDSSGTHALYLKSLNFKTNFNHCSVNIDPIAVDKIKSKNLKAICANAEDMIQEMQFCNKTALLMFQVLEHIENPISFLKDAREKKNIKAIVLTVPYLKHSRIGLHALRKGKDESIEDKHIFELSAGDWKLLFKHCGWKVAYEDIYYQYPRRSLLRWFWKWFWTRFDYEGFYGVILEKE